VINATLVGRAGHCGRLGKIWFTGELFIHYDTHRPHV